MIEGSIYLTQKEREDILVLTCLTRRYRYSYIFRKLCEAGLSLRSFYTVSNSSGAFINWKYISSGKGKGQFLLPPWTGMVIGIQLAHVEKSAKLQFPRLQGDVGEISEPGNCHSCWEPGCDTPTAKSGSVQDNTVCSACITWSSSAGLSCSLLVNS